MKLKKFGQFVNGINENSEFDDDFRLDDDLSDDEVISSDETNPAPVVGEEEEPEQVYKGDTALIRLAELLGAEVDKETNSIPYKGKTINWFSETEKYQIENKRFETAEEVVEYFKHDDVEEDEIEINDLEDMEDDLDEDEDIDLDEDEVEDGSQNESFGYIRKFK